MLLVDEVLPRLKDTELRVLLVVLRQTHVAGKETARCWLTHGELCRRTGRASEAVSGAIETLVKQSLLQVFDQAGMRLSTARERQQAPGRHFYRVAPFDYSDKRNALFRDDLPSSENVSAVGKAKTIEDIDISYCFRKTDQSDISFSESENGSDNPSVSIATPGTEQRDKAKEAIRKRLATLPLRSHRDGRGS